ncbi:putative Opacity protein or related surface antigen [Methylacidimicrobium sp. AP8]|uniref:hypothetical protein n=1 Tax=Methylacidimicrobium sp. AP8 TaxID=2730359 RepID=UPI0018C104C6|nr:hypothetical protein [Methylacidimicrobium sp. AP8]CAB4242377.1 putative Opacity protein or related surface antigen [Methylacidimicrobium sp. AP8]
MKRRTWKATALLAGVSCLLTLGALPLRAGTTAAQDSEEDGVTVPQGHKEAYEAAKEQMKEAPKEEHKSGAWFMAGAAGMGWGWFDNGSVVNNATGFGTQLNGNWNQVFTGGLLGGYYWHDPDKWGNLSFTAEALGLFTGATMGSSAMGIAATQQAVNVGLLGLGGTIGYRIAKSFEPFVGFYGGGAIGNMGLDGVNLGTVWGYFFTPALGLRYFIPNSHWFIGAEALFLFIGDLNGYNKMSGVTVNTTTGNSYIYEPVVMMTIGYAF